MPDFKLDVPFHLGNPWEFPQYGVPLRASIPLPQGAVKDPAAEMALVDDHGRDVGAQWKVLSTWKDGSAKFALMDYAATGLAPRSSMALTLKKRSEVAKAQRLPSLGSSINIEEANDRITIDTGRLRWVLNANKFTFADEIHFHGREWVGGHEIDLIVEDAHGQIFRASDGEYRLRFEHRGPHRVVLLIEGDYRNVSGTRFMNYKLRLHFVAGGAQVLMSHTIRNRHDGREGRDVRRSALVGALKMDKTVRRVVHTARTLNTVMAMVEVPENIDLDTGDYQTTIRNAASLREPAEEACYSVREGLDMGRYGACMPLIDLVEPGVGGMLFKFAMPQPDHEGPMRLASDRNRFEIDFYPADPRKIYRPEPWGPMHLNEGMGKTRDVLFNFHDDSLKDLNRVHESDNLSYPGVVGVPDWMYRQAQVGDVHLTLVPQRTKYTVLESKIDMLLSAPWAYDWPKRNGWRDYGDEVGARGRAPEFGVEQFINNEEDYLHALMLDAWRTGRPYKGAAQARHLMDIDFIDHSSDPARNGADCPHSTGHTNGEVYPSHQWCQGLLYYYQATGDEEALYVSKRIGDNLIWWCTGPRSDSLHYSGRESAWPLLSLAALYDTTHEEKYREGGMVIIDEMLKSEKRHGHLAWEYPPGSGIYSGYMSQMVFNGIWDMYRATEDESLLELWKRTTKAEVERVAQPQGWGYIHFRNWPIKWADLTTLARWYDLTGDRKYLDMGKSGLRLVMNGCPQPLNQTQGFIAMGYRHFIFFMKLADEHGMLHDDQCVLVW